VTILRVEQDGNPVPNGEAEMVPSAEECVVVPFDFAVTARAYEKVSQIGALPSKGGAVSEKAFEAEPRSLGQESHNPRAPSVETGLAFSLGEKHRDRCRVVQIEGSVVWIANLVVDVSSPFVLNQQEAV